MPAPSKVSDRGQTVNKVAEAATLVDLATGSAITVGNFLVVRMSYDNSNTDGTNPGLTISDPAGLTWTTYFRTFTPTNVANDGICTCIALAQVTAGFADAADITVTWGTTQPPAKAIVVEEWTPTDVVVGPVHAQGQNQYPTLSITPTAAGQTVFAHVGIAGGPGASYTEDADTLEGTWVSMTSVGTTGDTGNSNATTRGATKQSTGVSTQDWGPTITAAVWATTGLVFAEAVTDSTAPTVGIDVVHGPGEVESVHDSANYDSANEIVTVTGTAADNLSVASVEVRVNGGTWGPATNTGTGFSTWSYEINLIGLPLADSHTIEARSIDTSSNVSTIASRTFYYSPDGKWAFKGAGQHAVPLTAHVYG